MNTYITKVLKRIAFKDLKCGSPFYGKNDVGTPVIGLAIIEGTGGYNCIDLQTGYLDRVEEDTVVESVYIEMREDK